MTQPGQTLTAAEADIQRLVHGGDGLGRLSTGEIVFVPGVMPGERVNVSLPASGVGKKKQVLKGKVSEWIQKSPDRIAPRCDVFEQCGGCQWQFMPVAVQRHWKREIVAESLRRIGKLPDVSVSEVIGVEEETSWQYRNAVQWVVDYSDPMEGTRIGYFATGSHDVVPFNRCEIIPDAWNAVARYLETCLTPETGVLEIHVRDFDNGRFRLHLLGEDEIPTLTESWCEAFRQEFPNALSIVWSAQSGGDAGQDSEDMMVYGDENADESVALSGSCFKISPGSFFQVNPPVTELMLGWMKGKISQCRNPETQEAGKFGTMLDLYAGVGLFSIVLAEFAEKIIAVESSENACADAEENIAKNGLDHVEVKCGAVEKSLEGLMSDLDSASACVILDPPRAGCDPGILTWLNEMGSGESGPESSPVSCELFYVSCDPATLARDLAKLSQGGWQIQAVQPFDMFPQTHHVETVVHLSR